MLYCSCAIPSFEVFFFHCIFFYQEPSRFNNAVLTTGSMHADSSSSSSSNDAVPYNALAELNLREHSAPVDGLAMHLRQQTEKSGKAEHGPSNPSPFDDIQFNPFDRPQRSLVTSIFNSVPGVPVDWLQSSYQKTVVPSFSSTQPSRLPPPPPTRTVSSLGSNGSPAATEIANSNPLFGTQKGEATKRLDHKARIFFYHC